MKRYFFAVMIVALASCANVTAQDGSHAFLKEGKVWNCVLQYGPDGNTEYYKNIIRGDSVVNGITYFKMYRETDTVSELDFYALWREDEGKVYTYVPSDGKERMMYDFSAQPESEVFCEGRNRQVKAVGKVTVGEQRFNCLSVLVSDGFLITWVEGIGSPYGPGYPIGPMLSNGKITELLSCYEDGHLIFEATDFNKAFRADVKINEANFPDENFRNWMLSQNYGVDGVLKSEELGNISSLDVRRLEIHDLKGIEHFFALIKLNCMTNKLTALDLSKNTALEKLECIGNRLKTINLQGNKRLKFLSCGGNQLTALDVSGCTELDTLSCSSNQLTALNVSKNTKLTCLECYSNQLTALNLSKNTALGRLHCNVNQLTALDVSKNTALHLLQCSGNLLTTLDVTKNSALKDLSCNKNKLTTLNVLNNKSLEWIICSDNQLTSLDVSGCSALKSLGCSDNQLSTLNLSGCPTLVELHCDGNQLTTLDLSENPALISLYCNRNKIMDIGMDALVESLPIVSVASLYVMNFEKEQNVMTTTQVSAAKAKGWTPYILTYSIRMEYAGSETPQDDYRPFVEEGKVWKCGSTAGISDGIVKMVEYYYFDGDTIIDGKTCKQMMCQRYVSPNHPNYAAMSQIPSLRYVGAWYEEDKKVYIYNAINQLKMAYDFSLKANDTLFIDNQPYVIGPKQTGGLKGFKGVYRDVMWCGSVNSYCTTWLEGVGGIDGPTVNVYYGKEGHGLFLMSCTVGDEVIYLNDEVEDGATPKDLEARKNRFDFTHTIKTKPKAPSKRGEEQMLYGEYNDLRLGINLNPLEDAYLVRITNESGEVAYEKTVNASAIVGLDIDISAYAKGRYTVTVENSLEAFTGQFETQTSGIEAISNQPSAVKHHIYNLQGQRLSTLQKGLNIVNGQKIYVK